ncbi:hypothetical protein L6164_015265 [Bauhinia variegata]|uniref:Uncharacterized protein n=1 Tax=Bauhinia variegata TaxID=167791 RepID=A0ACB9NM29_BAUVA|nr:hypothetical protein L6164_015265 [Bauhinia variegata]
MDKPRDVGRGASRSSTAKRHMKPSGYKLIGGLQGIVGSFEFSDKSKKKVPSSSTIASKRFKIPKKFLDHCNGIDHASVPRKLRSAMKKRNRESILLDSGKVNHKMNEVETPEKDGIKKSKKQRTPDWSLRQTLSGSITKDEEEVAETLYALAGMFPDSSLNCRSKLDGMSMPERSILPDIEIEASPNAALQGTGQDTSSCCAESLSGEATKTKFIHKTIDHVDFPESAKFLMASNNGAAAPKMNLQTMPMLVKSDYGNEISLHDSGLRLAIGQSDLPHVETKLEIASEMTRAVEGKQEHRMIKEPKRNGPALWPGLSPAATSGNQASFLRSTAAEAPLWLDAAMCHSKQDMREGCCGGKVSIVTDKRLWKRSAAHVHITRLIQCLQVPISKDISQTQPNQSNQMRADEGLKHGVLMEIHDSGGLRNEALSMPGTGHSAAANNSQEIETDIFKQQRLYHGISKATPTSGVNSPQKQRFNFLPLSIGVSGLNVNNDYNKVGSGFEPLSKLQVPYLQSPARQHGLQPFSMPQSQYVSTYRDQVSVGGPQVRLQLPHYYGSPLRGSATASNKHQSFWAVQLAAQNRSAVNCNMTSQYPNWPSGRQDSPVIDPCAQAIQSNSPASLGPKITQQHQHFIALASSTSRTSGLDFHFPSICEESRGRFRSNVTPSLQLLCDESI